MKVLVLNCGSSSLKYQLIDMENEHVMAKGLCERIGIDGSMTHSIPGQDKIKKDVALPGHQEAVKYVVDALTDKEHGCIESVEEISAVGHRVLHGGQYFSDSVVIDDKVIAAIEECVDLGPLHNPANLIGIEACRVLMPKVPQVAVFDTAFHQTMPEKAYLYGIPYEYYEKYHIRRYGFHGTSHNYVSHKAAEFLGKDIKDLKIVVCHLGNGASICAVKDGKSVDTSMGLTPLEGLIMGTRSGDLDPAIVEYIAKKEDLDVSEVLTILNKKSGVLGMSKISSDFRDLESAAKEGNERAVATLAAYDYRVAKYIGSYAAAMNGLDVIVFTGGVGENAGATRAGICESLSFLGVELDAEANSKREDEMNISSSTAKVQTLVIATNEELMIARETKRLA